MLILSKRSQLLPEMKRFPSTETPQCFRHYAAFSERKILFFVSSWGKSDFRVFFSMKGTRLFCRCRAMVGFMNS